MSMTKWCCLGVFALSIVSAVGCGSNSPAKRDKCPAGTAANQPVPGCLCGDAGIKGVQTCGTDGFLSICVCGGGSSGNGGGSGDGASGSNSAGNAGSTGGGSGTTASGDDGGVAGKGGGSGTSGGAGGGGAGSGSPAPTKPPADGSQLAACDPASSTSCTAPLSCYTANNATPVGFCTKTCTMNSDCTALGSMFTCSTATGVGFPGGGGGTQYCRQACSGLDDTSCPQFMSCKAVQGGYRCLYDQKDVGKGNVAEWKACTGSGDCTGDLICFGGGVLTGTGPGGMSYQGFCTQPCKATADCTDTPPTGDVKADCNTAVGECRLNCTRMLGQTKKCPDGMTCAAILGTGGGAMRCVYSATSSGGV